MKSLIFLILAIVLPINIYCSIDLNSKFPALPPQLANSNLTVEDAKSFLKEKCKIVSGDDVAFTDLETGAHEFASCLSNIFNKTTLQSEIDLAKPIGELDTVFNKYCKKRPDVMSCLTTFTDKFERCLDEEEKKFNNIIIRVIQSILNFICYKGGDHIALFIAEKGPECLQTNKQTIQDCFNSTFADYIPKTIPNSISDIPKFTFGAKQCGEIKDLGSCIVKGLEKCDEITPANIVESMFRFIKNETKCD